MRSPGITERRASQVRPAGSGAAGHETSGLLVVEEPLEIRVATDPVAVTMRTPGDDALLAVGFLFAEGILRSIDDVGAVSHCGRPGDPGFGNVIEVTAAPGVVLEIDRVEASRRGTLTTSACGVCGRRSIDDLIARCAPLPDGPRVPAAMLATAIERLTSSQSNFPLTGGAHAAALLDSAGGLLAAFEDVGRHNAVDKAVGALLYERRLPASPPALLAVSGRASFEIVQKAARAGVPIVVSVSAATSLAVDLALRCGITLAAFVRGGEANLYSRPERISGLR
ncbi:MAG: formate dehydrogenase accessory sulfurtransferase FdhD [Myxococcaceae bacterium]